MRKYLIFFGLCTGLSDTFYGMFCLAYGGVKNMLRKSKHKTVLVANLNGEQVVFLVRKKYKTALKCYIDDMVNEYLDIVPPQSLKDFIIDSIIKMQGEWIEILAGIDVYDAVAEV